MDKRQRILFTAFILSLLIHAGFLWLMDYQGWLTYDTKNIKKAQPEEVTIVFPENKPRPQQPREVVQNMNENENVPTDASLLSEKNSQARNPVKSDKISTSPLSRGNSPFSNLSGAQSKKKNSFFKKKTFSKNALRGRTAKTPSERYREEQKQSASASAGSNQMMNQRNFSVEEVGALSLSTYKWQWAPYINAMKNKLTRVWFPPAAYYQLGLIHGQTVLRYTISKEGKILDLTVLDHSGHESLKTSSVKAIESLFPFLPLPEDFPDETLTITAKLFYPDLRNRR